MGCKSMFDKLKNLYTGEEQSYEYEEISNKSKLLKFIKKIFSLQNVVIYVIAFALRES